MKTLQLALDIVQVILYIIIIVILLKDLKRK